MDRPSDNRCKLRQAPLVLVIATMRSERGGEIWAPKVAVQIVAQHCAHSEEEKILLQSVGESRALNREKVK